ncbi:hypothetical protein EON65_36385 [archaeon]|nr:MAG: hypothetical protein EON65_36385 [archaeon]
MSILLLDNGGGSAKVGLHEDLAVQYGAAPPEKIPDPIVLPNLTAKVQKSMQYLVSDQVNDFLNASLLTFVRPFERGYMTNVQCELEVWSHIFQDKCRVKPYETTLVLTEPLLNLPSIQNDLNEVVFEYFNFQSYLRQPAPCFTAYSQTRSDPQLNLGLTVVDSGFSFTHIVPFIQNKLQKHAVKRINIGGKLLTNYLKELVSYRQWNMMDEFILMNQIKEQLCYVSDNLVKDLEEGRKLSRAQRVEGMRDHLGGRLKKHFVLPDFQNVLKGYVKPDVEPIEPHEQVILTSSWHTIEYSSWVLPPSFLRSLSLSRHLN